MYTFGVASIMGMCKDLSEDQVDTGILAPSVVPALDDTEIVAEKSVVFIHAVSTGDGEHE